MEELFGVPMTYIMIALVVILLPASAVIGVMAWRNPVVFKLGLRNIPRRWAQTGLIIVGITISTLIMTVAFGIGDAINFSVRSQATEALGPIDEIILSTRATGGDSFGSYAYFPQERFAQLKQDLRDIEAIDGLAPGIAEIVPAVNLRTLRAEGSMRIAGVDPESLVDLGNITLLSGEPVLLESLAANEAFINEEAANELAALTGDQLRIIVLGQPLFITVKEIVGRGGLAGDQSTMIISLDMAQLLFQRQGQINSIVVSNQGDEITGADLSDDVTDRLRILFADSTIAGRLQAFLSRGDTRLALETSQASLRGGLADDLSSLINLLPQQRATEELISLLIDEDVADEVIEALKSAGLDAIALQAATMFSDLSEFQVVDIKKQTLDVANDVANGVTTFFIILGLFSILVGVLLIFLIFVMLAAARRTEMGMARAIGARRSHLVQMFVFEGATYAVASAFVGVLVGLGVSALIVFVANQIIGTVEESFKFTYHFEIRSVVVAYCLGMVITFSTVAFSAYRVSRMNIVVAIRGLPETFVVSQGAVLRARLMGIVRAVARPLVFATRAFIAGLHLKTGNAALHAGLAALWVLICPIWMVDIIVATFRLVWPYLLQGWLTIILGVLITFLGTGFDEAGPFRIGVSLVILGVGLQIRILLRHTSMRLETRDRLSFTIIGVMMLIFWVLPFSTLRLLAGEMNGGPEMFFISGIAMVAAAVWTVMYNSDLMLRALNLLASRAGRMRPVIVTAVAYPMSAKFRTGLTLAMFALVIFTLIVVSILTEAFRTSPENLSIATGGWDIEASLNPANPVEDIHQAIADSPDLRVDDFTAIGGFTTIPIEVRQVGAENQRWKQYMARAADDEFLGSTHHRLKLISDGYGPTDGEVWQALRDDPSLAVVDAVVLASRGRFDEDEVEFKMESLYYEDDDMHPIDIQVRDPRTGTVVPITVIGVMDVITDSFSRTGMGMFALKDNLEQVLPFPMPITTYRFRMAEGVNIAAVASNLDKAFQQNGMEAKVLKELVEEHNAAERAFNKLFIAYMGMGLMVGIAALGVISLRAVVERRQQIGVLRAIGYRRRMVQWSFLLESSFLALLGVAIGVGLGIILSYNIVRDIQDDIETIRFHIPWLQIMVIVMVVYFFSLLTTYLPARQASRIYPAEALRYE